MRFNVDNATVSAEELHEDLTGKPLRPSTEDNSHIPDTPDVELGDGPDAEENKFNSDYEEVTVTNVEPADSSESPQAMSVKNNVDFEKVKEGFTEVRNTYKASEELNIVAQEMFAIIGAKGHIASVEARLLSHALADIERRVGITIDTVSVENYAPEFDLELNSQVSMEGVIQALAKLDNIILNAIEGAIRVTMDFFKSFTPMINARRKKLSELMQHVDNSNREAGLKEITGSWTADLSIDGRIPEAKTVLTTLRQLDVISKDFLTTEADARLMAAVNDMVSEMQADLDVDNVKRASKWWFVASALGFLTGNDALYAAGEIGGSVDGVNKALKSLKLDSTTLPKIRELFPTIAQVSLGTPKDDDRVALYRSTPLFGDTVLSIRDLDLDKAFRNRERLLSPRLRINSVGLGVFLNKGKPKPGTIQTLTSQQQREAIQATLVLLDDCEAYYKNYGSRVSGRYQSWKEAFTKGSRVFDGAWLAFHPTRMTAFQSILGIGRLMTNLYWSGIYKTQVDYIRYIARTSDAISAYVTESMKGTQAERIRDGE